MNETDLAGLLSQQLKVLAHQLEETGKVGVFRPLLDGGEAVVVFSLVKNRALQLHEYVPAVTIPQEIVPVAEEEEKPKRKRKNDE